MNQRLEKLKSPSDGVPALTRLRLPAEMRVHQILDAALQAFANEGYAATRIDDIARLAGLSKGGIYTHFKSKDEIFEALLTRSLAPRAVHGEVPPDTPVSVALLVEHIIDRMYDDLTDSQTLLALRLLFADGGKVPQRVAQWRRGAMATNCAGTVQRHVPDGVRRDDADGGGQAPPCACGDAARAAGAARVRRGCHCVRLNPAAAWQSEFRRRLSWRLKAARVIRPGRSGHRNRQDLVTQRCRLELAAEVERAAFPTCTVKVPDAGHPILGLKHVEVR